MSHPDFDENLIEYLMDQCGRELMEEGEEEGLRTIAKRILNYAQMSPGEARAELEERVEQAHLNQEIDLAFSKGD